jgi:N-ethylmaleimide reductase
MPCLQRRTGNALFRDGYGDAVAFGAPFISNPDLVERFSSDLKLSPSNPDNYYAGGATGYVDYPTATEQVGVR